MAAYADEHGVTTLQTEEPHGADDNWLPSPFALAGALLGATFPSTHLPEPAAY